VSDALMPLLIGTLMIAMILFMYALCRIVMMLREAKAELIISREHLTEMSNILRRVDQNLGRLEAVLIKSLTLEAGQ
jgi:hypothetical protein